jgi:hypothetical protein
MTNDYSFEEFSITKGRFSPLVSLVETGGIGISSGFTKKYGLTSENTAAVKFLYDRSNKAIGMRFLPVKEDGALNVKFAQRGGAHLNAKAFWVKFDIDHKKYIGKYTPTEIQHPQFGKVYVFDLKETSSTKS